MSFWGSLFGGSNSTINQGINKAGQVAGYGTTKGEGLTTQAGNFFSSLLSGNPAQTAKMLSPQISATQQQAQQQKQTNAQFGNRSGGTNAKNQSIDDATRSKISDAISKLTGSAAGASADLGKSLIDTGIGALSKQVDFSQAQIENWTNSILGQGTSSAVGYAESAALGA